MQYQLLTIAAIAAGLRRLRRLDAKRPHLVVAYDDTRFDWRSFDQCNSDDLPSLDFGQRADCRWSVSGGQSVHAHWYADRVEFHLDLVDPRRNALGHLARDTNILEGAAIAAIAVGAAGGSWGAALAAACAGAGVAAMTDPGASSRWGLDGVDVDGGWRFARLVQPDGVLRLA